MCVVVDFEFVFVEEVIFFVWGFDLEFTDRNKIDLNRLLYLLHEMIGTYLGMSQNGGAQECPKPLLFSVQNKALGHSFFETSPFTKSEKHK